MRRKTLKKASLRGLGGVPNFFSSHNFFVCCDNKFCSADEEEVRVLYERDELLLLLVQVPSLLLNDVFFFFWVGRRLPMHNRLKICEKIRRRLILVFRGFYIF